jgi:SAM-dependent methyltransferase
VVYPKICNCIQGRLLDLGCGIGDMLKFYPNSVGVDINPYTVEFCNKSGLKAFLIDSDKLPFKPESFDTILLDNVLEHIQEPSNLLFEISRVLKKPGQLIIGLPGDKGFLMDIDHKFNYKKADLLPLLENVGMKIVSEFFTPFKSNFLNKVFKRYCVYYVAIKS